MYPMKNLLTKVKDWTGCLVQMTIAHNMRGRPTDFDDLCAAIVTPLTAGRTSDFYDLCSLRCHRNTTDILFDLGLLCSFTFDSQMVEQVSSK